jgi:chemotaxis protein histidine kinase CheA/CheY-like chemotaxis protein
MKTIEPLVSHFCGELMQEVSLVADILKNIYRQGGVQSSETVVSANQYIHKVIHVAVVLKLQDVVVFSRELVFFLKKIAEKKASQEAFILSVESSQALLDTLKRYQRGLAPDIHNGLYPFYVRLAVQNGKKEEQLHVSDLWSLPTPHLTEPLVLEDPNKWLDWRHRFEKYLLDWLKGNSGTLVQMKSLMEEVSQYQHPARRAFWVAQGLFDRVLHLSKQKKAAARTYIGQIIWLFRHAAEGGIQVIQKFEREVLFFLSDNFSPGEYGQIVLSSYGLFETTEPREVGVEKSAFDTKQDILGVFQNIEASLIQESFESVHSLCVRLRQMLLGNDAAWDRVANLLCQVTESNQKMKQLSFRVELLAAIEWFSRLWNRSGFHQSDLLIKGIEGLCALRDQVESFSYPWSEVVEAVPIESRPHLLELTQYAKKLLALAIEKKRDSHNPHIQEMSQVLDLIASGLSDEGQIVAAKTVRAMKGRLDGVLLRGDVALQFSQSIEALDTYVSLLEEGHPDFSAKFLEAEGVIESGVYAVSDALDKVLNIERKKKIQPLSAVHGFSDIFYTEADDIIRELKDILADKDIGFNILMVQCRRLFHTLKGSGCMLGLGDFCAVADKVGLDIHVRCNASPDIGFRDFLYGVVIRLEAWLDAHRQHRPLPDLLDLVSEEKVVSVNDIGQVDGLSVVKWDSPNQQGREDQKSKGIELESNQDESIDSLLEMEIPEVVENSYEDPSSMNKPQTEASTKAVLLREAQEKNSALVDSLVGEIFSLFCGEMEEALPELERLFDDWEKEVSSAKQDILGLLHRLKGSAGISGARRLAALMHDLEECILEKDQVVLAKDLFKQISNLFVEMTSAGTLASTATENNDSLSFSSDVDGMNPHQADSSSNLSSRHSSVHLVSPTSFKHDFVARSEDSIQEIKIQIRDISRLSNELQEIGIKRTQASELVKQVYHQIDELVEKASDMGNLARDLELALDGNVMKMNRREKQRGTDFDVHELEEYLPLQEQARAFNKVISEFSEMLQQTRSQAPHLDQLFFGLQQQIRGVQVDFVNLRLVSVKSIEPRLLRTVAHVGSSLGKSVSLILTGTQCQIDQTLLVSLIPILEHLLRNAIWHGIEEPSERAVAGKPAKGRITINFSQKDNRLLIAVSDDGRGLDTQKILTSAKQQGVVGVNENLTKNQIENLIFMPNLSTQSVPNQYAGHGIGLDFVRVQVSAMGGNVRVESEYGQGVRFFVSLPNHQFSMRVLLVVVGDQQYAIPTHLLDSVLSISTEGISQALEKRFVWHEKNQIPVVRFAELLGVKSGEVDRASQIVLVNSATQPIALQVQKIVGYSELMMKGVGLPLSQVPGVLGASVLSNGLPVLLLDPFFLWIGRHGATSVSSEAVLSPVELLSDEKIKEPTERALEEDESSLGDIRTTLAGSGLVNVTSLDSSDMSGGQEFREFREFSSGGKKPVVLVVDDSSTVRHVTKSLLSKQGYQVELACDGLEAWERLQTLLPDVILLDIEMPKWDGFQLTQAIRENDRLKEIPILMISSRSANKHSGYAKTVGADMFIGKPFPENTVLNSVRRAVTHGRRGLRQD